ncbi:hypothetical protein MRX96_038860 [Rhipicephalus microplus]
MATREWNPWNAGSPLLQDAARFPQMASTQLACRECSMQFSGPTPYMDHLKSARHQKKVAAHRLLAEIAAGGAPVNSSPEVMTVATPSAARQPSTQTAAMPFVCKLCDVAMNCEDAMIAHTKEKQEQNGEVIDLSCRVCGIVLFEHVGYKLEHLETEAHRKKKMQVAGGQRLVTNNALNPQLGAEPCNR